MDVLRMMALLAGAGLVGVLGCSPSSDPRQGGLAGGIYGLSSGAYDERVQARRESLSRLESIQAKLETERAELEVEKRSSEVRLSDEQRRLKTLQENTKALANNVRYLSENLQRDDARVNTVRAGVTELEREIKDIEVATDAGQLKQEQLRRKSVVLEDEYRKLMDLYIELAK